MSQIVLRLSPLPDRGGEPLEAAPDEAGAAAGDVVQRADGSAREPVESVAGGDDAGAVTLAAPNGQHAEPRLAGAVTPLARWSATVGAAHDACVLLDPGGNVVSLSVPGATLLGCAEAGVIGRPLLDVVRLVDFEAGDSHPDYAGRIPPLAALKFVTLVRGLLRVRHPDDRLVTVDAVAAPLHDADGTLIGSLAFLAAVTPG